MTWLICGIATAAIFWFKERNSLMTDDFSGCFLMANAMLFLVAIGPIGLVLMLLALLIQFVANL